MVAFLVALDTPRCRYRGRTHGVRLFCIVFLLSHTLLVHLATFRFLVSLSLVVSSSVGVLPLFGVTSVISTSLIACLVSVSAPMHETLKHSSGVLISACPTTRFTRAVLPFTVVPRFSFIRALTLESSVQASTVLALKLLVLTSTRVLMISYVTFVGVLLL